MLRKHQKVLFNNKKKLINLRENDERVEFHHFLTNIVTTEIFLAIDCRIIIFS